MWTSQGSLNSHEHLRRTGSSDRCSYDLRRTRMSLRFDGKVAVVTGASRGIGLGIATRLVSEGAKVMITARKSEHLSTAAQALGGTRAVLTAAGRADDPEHQAEAVQRTLDGFGRLDILVNGAGINPVLGPLVDLDPAAARKIFEVNCLAALSWATCAHRVWMGEHGGSIVNISSIGALKPAPGVGFYGASKAMLGHITSQLALELAPHIRVNAIAPGVVKTRFAGALYEGREDEVAATYPLQRLGTPEDVSGVVAFLLSEEARWITGQTIVVDGGLTLTGGV